MKIMRIKTGYKAWYQAQYPNFSIVFGDGETAIFGEIYLIEGKPYRRTEYPVSVSIPVRFLEPAE